MSRSLKVILAISLAVIVGSAGFIGGVFFMDSRSPAIPAATSIITGDSNFGSIGAKVDEVKAILAKQALTPPSDTTATAGAVQGLLDANGDKYAAYFDARHFKMFNETSAGEFGGIGVVLAEKSGRAYVVEVYPNTPAAKAGIKANDVFVGIDGVKRAKWTSDEIVKRVRGKAGTKVTLIMSRPGKKGTPAKDYTFTLTRAMINLPNIRAKMLSGNVGYIRLGQFNAKSAMDIASKVESLRKKGAKSYILDLRENPGGLLEQAVQVTSLFVKSGAVVEVDERGKAPEISNVTGHVITDAPLVVLVDGNSASASEIVSGALQDHGRATIVGEKTFGKGSVQTIEPLKDGSAIKFTIAHYLTPKHHVINNIGLTPNVVVKMPLEKQRDQKTDIQLQKAIEIAKKGGK